MGIRKVTEQWPLEIRLPEYELDDETFFKLWACFQAASRTQRNANSQPLQLGVSGDDPDAGEETTDPDDPMERTGTMMIRISRGRWWR